MGMWQDGSGHLITDINPNTFPCFTLFLFPISLTPMDLIRLKKAIAGVSVATIALTQVSTAFAAYSDVPSGVWYGEAVQAFLDAGYLDASQPRFRGAEPANRAEFVKLVVELNGGILSTPPAVPSFSDVATNAWYFGYFEEAGKEGWVRGDGDCYGDTPCYARPSANIVRAEAAALIVRSFGLEATDDAPQFVDNPSGQWYTDVIQTAADHCVLQGDDNTSRVRPGDNMNRAEMVTMLHRVDQGLQYGVDCGGDNVGAPMIVDIVATSATTVEVEFNVALDATVAEDAAIYTVMNGSEIAVNSAELTGTDLVELTLASALDPDGEYTLTVTDAKTAAGEEFSDSADFNGYSPIVKGDGILEVSLASSNPVGDTVPKGANGVVMLSLDLTASCDDSVVIEDFTVLHEGFGTSSELTGVFGSIDGARVTRKRTIDSEDQTADLRFSSPLVIDACESVTLDVVVDFDTSAVASAEHNLVLELASDIVSNALDTTGNYPLRGNTFRVAAVTSGTVTVTYRSVTPTEAEVGEKAVVLGKFEVASNSVEDQTFYSMTLEQNGSASDGDFSNLAIRRTDGTVLTNTVAQTVGDFVTLVFDPPFTVLEGDKITLEVIGDINGGAGDTIQLAFEETSDVFAVGSLYGYGVNGQLYGSQVSIGATPAATTITIDAGEFTIGINGPAQQDFTRDDNDAVLANVSFQTGGEKIDVKEFFVAIQGTTSTGAMLCGGNSAAAFDITDDCPTGTDDEISEVLEDVEMRNKTTGRTISAVRLTTSGTSGHSSTGTNSGTYQIYRFDDFVVDGDETWEFRADFIDNGAAAHPASGDKFKIHICGEPTKILVDSVLTTNSTGCSFGGLITAATAYQMQVEGLSTGDNVGDVRPRGNISGNFHSISNAALQIAVKNLNSTDTSVKNAKDVRLLRFEARAGEAEDVLFTKAVFETALGSLNNAQNYTLWADTDGDGVVDTKLQQGVAAQSSAVSFNQLSGGGFVIPAEQTVVFEVHADIASSLTSTSIQLRFATGTTTMIEAEELDDGSSLSGITVTGGGTTVTLPSTSTTTDIDVTYVASTTWTLTTSGDLFVKLDSTPTRSRQLLGGALGEAVLRLEFHAENEAIDVTDVMVSASGSVTFIDNLELWLSGGTSPIALATVAGCTAGQTLTTNPLQGGSDVTTFCANMDSRQLVIPEGGDVDVLVRPRVKNDQSGGTSTASKFKFFVFNNNVSSTTGSIRARGDQSSNDLTFNDGDATAEGEVFVGTSTATTGTTIQGNFNNAVLSKIISITNANPAPNNSNIPSGVTPFGQFKFTAANHTNSNNGDNDATLSGIIFNVTATNVLMDEDFFLYNSGDSTVKHACDAYDTGGDISVAIASGSFLVVCDNILTSSVDTAINKGEDITLVLEGTVTNPQVSSSASSTLQASLQTFDSITYTGFDYDANGTTTDSHIQWLDKDNSTSTSFNWVEYGETNISSTSYKS